VRGVTKKGKEFFRFTSGLTDAISHLDVAEAHIWAACQQVHSHYVDGQDKGLYMAPDVIMATEVRGRAQHCCVAAEHAVACRQPSSGVEVC
jgi:Bardet-Biedl syndrome 7 protein